jgi:transposase-like protein
MGRSGTVNLTDRMKEIADTYRESGLNVSETARRLGVTRQTIQNYLVDAHQHDYLKDEEMRAPNAPSAEDYMAARDRKIAAYQAKKRKGDWRKPVMTTLRRNPTVSRSLATRT